VYFTDSQTDNEEKEFELVGLEIEMLYPDVEQELIGLKIDVLCSDEDEEQKSKLKR